MRRVEKPDPVPVAIAILEGPSLIIEWGNEYMYSMAERFTDEEILGHSIAEFLPIAQSAEVERALNNCCDTGEPSHLSGEIVGPGGVMPMRASVYRIPQGKLLITAWHPFPGPIAEADAPLGTMRAGDEVPDRGQE